MFELLRKSVTIEIAPRAGVFLWLYRQVPFVHAIGGLDFWVTASVITLVALTIGVDCWRIRQVLQDRKSACYWADLQARRRNLDIDLDEDIF
jgi:hypothetical protein